MGRVKHHFESILKAAPEDYLPKLYRSTCWTMEMAQAAGLSERVRFERDHTDRFGNINYREMQVGFGCSVHLKRPVAESMWWLRLQYDWRLNHFKRHLMPNQRQSLPLPFDGEVLNLRGHRQNTGLRFYDWVKVVLLAIYFNDRDALTLLSTFTRSDIAQDENAQFMSPFQYAQFDLVQQLLLSDEQALEKAIQDYMVVDLSVRHPGDDLTTIQLMDLPRMDCLLALFTNAAQEKYQTQMAEALKKFIQWSRRSKDDISIHFPFDLICIAHRVYKERGYLLPEHPYMPQYLLTCDTADIQPPERLTEKPDY